MLTNSAGLHLSVGHTDSSATTTMSSHSNSQMEIKSVGRSFISQEATEGKPLFDGISSEDQFNPRITEVASPSYEKCDYVRSKPGSVFSTEEVKI